MKCSNCGNEVSNNAMFCDNCGKKVEIQRHDTQKQYCGNCGAEINLGVEFCGNCGARINIDKQEEPHIFCGNCGAELDSNTEFCGNCGAVVGYAHQNISKKPVKKKSKLPTVIAILVVVIILLVAFFIGCKFYFSDSKNAVLEQDISISGQTTNNTDSNDNKNSNHTEKSQPTPTPTPMPAPVFTYVTASSTRGTDTEGGQYSAEAVLNSDKMTKWVPSKDSNGGMYEWIQINASEAQYVKGVEILNGYHKSGETWSNNNRVKSCTLSFSNGQSQTVTLNDTMDLIKIDLDTPVNTTYIRLTINSVYSGTKWNDTAVTYLSAY